MVTIFLKMSTYSSALLDDLDKELNNYVMRCREWYGWHFPELGKILQDHQAYAKVVKLIGMRQTTKTADLSGILPEELEEQVKEAAEISMGTEISELDVINIRQLCEQIIEINNYRTELYEYLKNRMMALAPNLTVLLGELVGARLIAHAGSLMNLAKYPSSTVQILGAEKALFRALKTKKDTPKYGLLYHAQLVGQAPARLKGKMSRSLAAKAALGCRVDALGEDNTADLGIQHRAYLEGRIKALQEQGTKRISGMGRDKAKTESYKFKSEIMPYEEASTIPTKRTFNEDANEDEKPELKPPKAKKIKIEEEAAAEGEEEEETQVPKKKKKKKSRGGDAEQE